MVVNSDSWQEVSYRFQVALKATVAWQLLENESFYSIPTIHNAQLH